MKTGFRCALKDQGQECCEKDRDPCAGCKANCDECRVDPCDNCPGKVEDARPLPIPANLQHDAGAVAKCSCGRYTDNPMALQDPPFRCDCGKTNHWTGSFKPPGPDSTWSGKRRKRCSVGARMRALDRMIKALTVLEMDMEAENKAGRCCWSPDDFEAVKTWWKKPMVEELERLML